MNTKVVTAPCEACGGLLPLKPIIQTRRHVNKQRPRGSKDEGSSRGNDSHHARTERGSANNKCESSGELEAGLHASDSETDESSGKMRSYDSVLEEIQAIFADQKVKRETISPYMHRDHRRRERQQSRKLRRHKPGPQAHQQNAIISPRASEPERHKRPSRSPNSPCVLHPHQGRREIIINEPTRTRIVRPSPQDDASNCSFDPLRITPSPRLHAAQSCAHHLGEHSARAQARGEALAGDSSPPKQKHEYKSRHDAVDNNHRDTARHLVSESPNAQPRMNNDCYQDILRVYENCHIHQIDEHITTTLIASPRRSSQTHGCEERSPVQPQPQQQIIYSCHQHTVVQHHEESCHLHPDPESPRARSPRPRNYSRKCQRCGCPKAASPQGQPADRRHSPKASMKPERRSPEQEVKACTQRLSPRCKIHGDCGTKQQQNVDVCGVCCHPKQDHKASSEDQSCPPALQHSSCKNRHDSPSPAIQGCPLHGLPNPKCQEPKVTTNPKCNEPKDPLVWAPRRVRKPKPCSSVHWLDRLVASQKFPAHIIQQFLQGKRKCPPGVKKPRCAACMAKCRDPCEREVRDSDPHIVECHKEQPRRGKLSRLALSRSLIIRPVLKLSTAQGSWSTRKEFQVCSECRDPLSKNGGWKSILEEMSAGLCEGGIPKKRTGMKFLCQTIHGLVLPSGAGAQAVDLRCPELYSAFRLHSQLQKLQNEKFDRRAALQVAQAEGIELNKELFDQLLPEIKISNNKGSRRKRSKASPRNNVCRRQQQREVYHDLCKIVDPPMPVCQVQGPLRDVGVQVSNPSRPPEDFNLWNPNDFGAEPCAHLDRTMQSRLQPCTPKPTNWPKQEQPRCQQPLEKSWDEQHWAYLVKACKQARMEQGVYGSCAACQ